MVENAKDWREPLQKRFSDGWNPIIRCGDGWKDLIVGLIQALDRLEIPFKILQVKEKFGELRFYPEVDFHPKDGDDEDRLERFFAKIDEAQRRSIEICEDCGNAGYLDQRFAWAATLCDRCWELARARRLLDKSYFILGILVREARHGDSCREDACRCGLDDARDCVMFFEEEERWWNERHIGKWDR